MEVNGQLQAPTPLPTGKQEPGWAPEMVWTLDRKISCSSGYPTVIPLSSNSQSSLCSDYASLAAVQQKFEKKNLPHISSSFHWQFVYRYPFYNYRN
jgi:hypothetical protein